MAQSDMLLYTPGQNGDAELLEWYLRLVASEDIKKLYGPEGMALGVFVRDFTGDYGTTLVYAYDDIGWTTAGWFKPFMKGLAWGQWVREDYRGRPEPVDFAYEMHKWGFERVGLIMLATTQDTVVTKMAGLGYKEMPVIPHLYGVGHSGHVMFLTKEDFEKTQQLWKDKSHGRSARQR